MEENQPSIKKIALNYGLLLAGVGIVFSLILFSMDLQYERGWGIMVVNTLVMAAVLFLGINTFKKSNAGFLSLGQAIKVGLAIAVISAVISIIYQMIFINFIDPDFMTTTMAMQKEQMLEQNPNMTQEQIDQATGMMETFSGPGAMVVFIFVGSLFFGLIISLIEGLILKKSKPEY